MESAENARRRIAERGPRYAITGTIRPGEAITQYADTAERAEVVRANFENPDKWGYRNVRVYPPEGSIDLAALGRDRTKAKAAFDEATAILRAGVLRALEADRAEAEVARAAGVDRMTVRSWAGKQ